MQFGQNNTPFTAEEFANRLARTKQRMAAVGLDALYVSEPANLNYLTGYDGWSFYVHQGVLVVQALDQPIWIGRGQDVNGARLTTLLPDDHIVGYSDDHVQSPAKHPMQVVAQVMRARGLDGARIGVEADSCYFSAKSLEVLRSSLPNAGFVDAEALVNWVRAVKSPAEIALMREAARICELTMQRAMDVIDAGVRQCDAAAEIIAASTRGTPSHGGDYAAIAPLMPTGVGTSCPHLTWRDAPFAAGTGTTVEVAGVRHHYHVPLTRTLYLGTPPDRMRRAADVVIEAGLAVAKPGALARNVHAAWTRAIERHGFSKESRCGYSVGLGYPPDWGEKTISFRPIDETVLEPGMTIHFMPGLWLEDWGIAISETILITGTGVETFCGFPRRLFVK